MTLTPRTRLPIKDPATGLHRSNIRYPDGRPPIVDGCRWCGGAWFGHGQGPWMGSHGFHQWEAPTEAQRAARRTACLPVLPVEAPARARCDAMNHNSVGGEVFCEIEDPDHEEDHDAGDGVTWERED